MAIGRAPGSSSMPSWVQAANSGAPIHPTGWGFVSHSHPGGRADLEATLQVLYAMW